MFRWDEVDTTAYDSTEVKMYRPMYEAAETVSVVAGNLELDDYAFQHLGSELLMYKILDTNFTQFMEARGDVSRLNKILIPVRDA